jgi:hypothetical protein
LNLNCLCKGTFCCKFDNFLGEKVHQFCKNNWGVISPYLNAIYVLASFSIVSTFNSYLFYNLFTNWYGILFGMTTNNITSENWKNTHTHTHTHTLTGTIQTFCHFLAKFWIKKRRNGIHCYKFHVSWGLNLTNFWEKWLFRGEFGHLLLQLKVLGLFFVGQFFYSSHGFFTSFSLWVTLDEGPRSRVQSWNRAILLDESHKLDPQPFYEGPRSKSDKSQLNPHDTILEGKSIDLNPQNKRAQKGSSWFEEPRCKLGSTACNSRIQFASNESKLVPRNLNPGPSSKV